MYYLLYYLICLIVVYIIIVKYTQPGYYPYYPTLSFLYPNNEREAFIVYEYNIHASNLSGGEVRRLMIARLLINKPSIVLLDEPKANKEYVYKYRDGRPSYKGNWRNTAGWTTVWITGQILEKIGPILATKY